MLMLTSTLLTLGVVVGAGHVLADPPAATSDDEDAILELPPGLIAHYSGSDGRSHARLDPAVRFVWGDSQPDPRVPSGEFTARWSGKLNVLAPGRHRLHIHAGGGTVRLTADGKTLLDAAADKPGWIDSEPVELEFGHHSLELDFRKTGHAAQIGLYWSGPRFQLERVPERLLFHDRQPVSLTQFDEGRLLVRGLRCAACHDLPDVQPVLRAPAVTHLSGNVSHDWLTAWIGGKKGPPAIAAAPSKDERGSANSPSASAIDDVKFRMPGLGISRDDARHIVAFLLAGSQPASPIARPNTSRAADEADRDAGEELFLSIGCLACHKLGALGNGRLFGGGDLSTVGSKRPVDFFARWLAEPAATNASHRMPVFPLSDQQRNDLAAYLSAQRESDAAPADAAPNGGPDDDPPGDPRHGAKLAAAHRCGACHDLPKLDNRALPPAPLRVARLAAKPNWGRSCLGEPDVAAHRPGYRLRPEQREAVIAYVTAMAIAPRASEAPIRASDTAADKPLDGARLLVERNCLACHSRGLAPGLGPRMPELIAAHPELAAVAAALTPPSLEDVGDKLRRPAIVEAVTTSRPPLRPWLKIRMPRFRFDGSEAEALADWFAATDLLPERPRQPKPALDDEALFAAGRRLVTGDGFGCTSCHQIGTAVPKQDNLAALGTDLSLVGNRIRQPWFDRWTRNPARIVPRMEMPAIEVPVRGVLDERLDDQLAALWHVLNVPRFTPPEAGAVRVVRTRNVPEEKERAAVLTDVFAIDRHPFVRPLAIGLPNRHTVLLDCEQNRLAGWWIGDAARERTRGKSWYWEAGGTHLVDVRPGESELSLLVGGAAREPVVGGQFAADLDSWQHTAERGVTFTYRLHFGGDAGEDTSRLVLRVAQTVTPMWQDGAERRGGFRRQIEIRGAPADSAIFWRLLPADVTGPLDGGRFTTTGGPAGSVSLRLIEPAGAALSVEGAGAPHARLTTRDGHNAIACEVEYTSELAADRYPQPPAAPVPLPAARLACVPGFDAVRLPLPASDMPTGFAWRGDGALLFSSLKGQVWLARDADGDGLEDVLQAISDELAAPYGLVARGDYIDVINKNGLVRLSDFDEEGRAGRTEIVADGWGHTDDYHDWAVGLAPDSSGGYTIALPCRQDKRSDKEARLRGSIVRLAPGKQTPDDPRSFTLEPVASGLRFPMGLARSRAGAVFATDNQGNYNPFNELNHIVPRAHYGFLNKVEAQAGTPPPRTGPAIEIPHPWTRSVNGIAFLDTPPAVREKSGRDVFGPFEGHLVGCEYDTRRLVRMSLQPVGNTFQGAVYPLSIEPPEGEDTFEGPVVCQVAPDGAVYVGNMRDSGWGGGQNTGSIVRLSATGRWPSGIAEIRAGRSGFTIDFTGSVDAQAGADPGNYGVVSYRRIPTPEYGGPDVDRQTARIRAVTLSADRRQAALLVDHLREGFVYEFRLQNLTGTGEPFFPAEAYYTLRKVPQ
ncbi:MAG: c-type cytochrome [Planctomycetia bacterium]|nr:c-type cytochrome [Planctomycetia bacterium]